jgi:hypothetical protein
MKGFIKSAINLQLICNLKNNIFKFQVKHYTRRFIKESKINVGLHREWNIYERKYGLRMFLK